MKKTGKEPSLLQNVMEAIATLKEKQGSTQKKIIERIADLHRKNKDNSGNVTLMVRRALDHGLHTGLIKHRSGKYLLGLDKRDYAIFRRFKQVSGQKAPAPDSCRRHRRRGRRGRRGRRRHSRRRHSRRRRARRRTISNEDLEATEDSGSGRSTPRETPEPQDKSRRRRRRGGRKRSRRSRGRGRRHSTQDKRESDAKSSNPELQPEKRRSDQEKIDYQHKSNTGHPDRTRDPERNQEDERIIYCGNPECLCNIKQEEDSPRSMFRENNYYNDSYLN